MNGKCFALAGVGAHTALSLVTIVTTNMSSRTEVSAPPQVHALTSHPGFPGPLALLLPEEKAGGITILGEPQKGGLLVWCPESPVTELLDTPGWRGQRYTSDSVSQNSNVPITRWRAFNPPAPRKRDPHV